MPRHFSSTLRRLDGPRAFLWILAISLLVRVGALALIARQPLVSDARTYHRMALDMLAGRAFAPVWPPGLSCYLVPFHQVMGERELVARLAMLPVHLLFCVVLFDLVRGVIGRGMANLAVLAFAVYPSFIYHAVTPVTHLPAAVCLLALLWLAERCERGRIRPGVLLVMGLILGWFALLRSSSLPFVLLVPACMLVRTRRVLAMLIPLAVGATVVAGWNVKASELAGRFVMINTAHSKNLFIGNNPYTPAYRTWWFSAHHPGDPAVPEGYGELVARIESCPPAERDGLYRQAALDHIRERPGLFIFRTLNRFRCYLGLDTYTPAFLIKAYHMAKWAGLLLFALDGAVYMPILVLAAVGLFLGRHAPVPTRLSWLALGAAILYSLPYWVTFSAPTYHLPIVPLLALPACAACSQLVTGSWRDVWIDLGHHPVRRWGLLLTFAILAAIQLEWLYDLSLRWGSA